MATEKKKTCLFDQEGLKIADSDELISDEEALKRTVEAHTCKFNIIYFANHYFNILSPTGDKIKITVYKKQGEFLEKLLHNNRLVTLQARQMGKTTSYVIFCLYQVIFQKNYRILIAANTKDTAIENLTKIKDAYEELPNWIKPSIKEWSKTKIVFENGVSIKVTATTASSGRSQSIDLLILDEFAFVAKNIQEEFWRASLPTVSSRPLAKIVIVSTPNGVGDKFHNVWKMATEGGSDDSGQVWIGHRIDWWDRPDRDEAWHQRELKSLGSEEAFQQEYGNRFTVQAGDKLITDKRIMELKAHVEKLGITASIRPVDVTKPDSPYMYTEYFQYEKNVTYVMGVDCAEGTGGDASVLYILDITHTDNIRLCAKFNSSKVIPEQYANIIYQMWKKYGKPKIMLEANACGMAVIDNLKNISRNSKDEFRFNFSDIINYNRPYPHTGINSNVSSKSKSMLNTQNILQSMHFEVMLPDDDLYRELPFCEKKDGSGNASYKANRGHHDDHILALNWALFVLDETVLPKHYNVEYKVDDDTGTRYPYLILSNDVDVDEYKNKGNGKNNDELLELAALWRRLGDVNRANMIMERFFELETEDTCGEWGRNPYEIDQSQFSESFKKKFFNGRFSADDYFRQPISDPHDTYTENFGFVM